MRLKEKKILQKFAAILKKFSAQGAKNVDYGTIISSILINIIIMIIPKHKETALPLFLMFLSFID